MLFIVGHSNAQAQKFDSTLKIGRVGYRIISSNKNIEQNEVHIKPIGFQSTARDINFFVKGRINQSEIDDLNNDGFPDLILYIYSGADEAYGTVYAFASNENKSLTPFVLPDVLLDGKLSDGYKGHDQFSLLEGSLMQKFPVYKPGDDKNKPTGGNRVVVYQVVHGENGGLIFKVQKFYDLK